ncbi:MAG: hypothetical protein ACXVCP_01310 [Bdellovibrio sp.]
MSVTQHSALIHITLDLVGGIEKARSLLERTKEFGQISAISSVYKRYLSKDHDDLSAKLEFVARFETILDVDQTLNLILSLCEVGVSGFTQKSRTEATLLVYDSMILMSPKLTLPYPELHRDPLIIRCAAEAWGQYEHPIYQKSLSELSKLALPSKLAEFYIQGKSLVDF